MSRLSLARTYLGIAGRSARRSLRDVYRAARALSGLSPVPIPEDAPSTADWHHPTPPGHPSLLCRCDDSRPLETTEGHRDDCPWLAVRCRTCQGDGYCIICRGDGTQPEDVPAGTTEAVERDARRYRRLRVLGAAPFGSDLLETGGVMCFTSLDAFIDEDLRAHPSRGETDPVAPAAHAPVPGEDPELNTPYEIVTRMRVEVSNIFGDAIGHRGYVVKMDDDTDMVIDEAAVISMRKVDP